MSLINVYYMAREYLFIGGILAVLIIVSFLVIRHFHAKRNGTTHRKINGKRLFWWLVFLCYIFVVIGATMLSRGSNYEYETISPLFFSYKNAWNSWSVTEWRNIILNICMFVPFGLLLPMGIKWFRKFYKTYAAGFLFSLLIELSQRIFKVGIFEPDDLLDNTLGAAIGFGLFIVLFKLYAKEKANLRKGATFASNIPLILTVAIFVSIYVSYSCKELGNNNNRYVKQYGINRINVYGEKFTDDSQRRLMVYESEALTEKEAYKRAEELFKKFDGEADIYYAGYYDDEAWIRARVGDEGSKEIRIKYAGGTYEYCDMDYGYSATDYYSKAATSYDEQEVREVLKEHGCDICSEAVFTAEDDMRFRFEVDRCEENGDIVDGSLEVKLSKDKRIILLKDNLITLKPYKEYDVISEAEAYKQLTEGKFKRYGNDYLNIEVIDCRIAYSIDTKGFYQPNYRFDVNINGKEAWIMIPALK
ncbi:MAG: VanZ family protein [Lachnospiraceae bacterium]|nr:VanZ family protein [Lachnospiraceae bacterium]